MGRRRFTGARGGARRQPGTATDLYTPGSPRQRAWPRRIRHDRVGTPRTDTPATLIAVSIENRVTGVRVACAAHVSARASSTGRCRFQATVPVTVCACLPTDVAPALACPSPSSSRFSPRFSADACRDDRHRRPAARRSGVRRQRLRHAHRHAMRRRCHRTTHRATDHLASRVESISLSISGSMAPNSRASIWRRTCAPRRRYAISQRVVRYSSCDAAMAS